MPILWDLAMTAVTGFLFSSLNPYLKNKYDIKLPEKVPYVIGLIFTQFIIMGISLWCWVAVDQNWLLLYWVNPATVGNVVQFLYLNFIFIYSGTYWLNLQLHKWKKSRYSLLIASSAWIIFTIVVFPGFVTIFGGDDTALLGADYPPQFLWYVTQFPPGNAFWFLPVSYGMFFYLFFIIVIVLLIIYGTIGIKIAQSNFAADAPNQPPSRILFFLAKLLLDFSNRMIVRTAKRDYRYQQILSGFNATIQISTADDLIHRFLVFDDKLGVTYANGKLENPDATILYHSVREMFTFLKSMGDVKGGLTENRFVFKGNMNILFKMEFLTNYLKSALLGQKNIPGFTQKIIAQWIKK